MAKDALMHKPVAARQPATNVMGTALVPCGTDPVTGFYRDGACNTGIQDKTSHTVCARVTAEFLQFSAKQGNDLTTPRPQFQFKGLRPGDCWCLCSRRWKQALVAGVAPPVVLRSSHHRVLDDVPLEVLLKHALDVSTH